MVDRSPAPRRRTPSRPVVTVARWILAVCLFGVLAWATRFGTRWPAVYFMTGASMEPTVSAEEYFFALSPPGELTRGDLVIFRFEDADTVFHVLRRLVAVSGDTVAMRAGAAIVNGVRQPWAFRIIEPAAWRSEGAWDTNLYDWGERIVPAGAVVLLSDTRDMLGWPDSRFIGPVQRADVLARVTHTVRGRRLR